MREAQLLRDIQLALGARRGIRVFRMNVGKARDPITGQVVTFGTPGMGDLLVLVGARYLWLELKGATGRQRPAQRAFQDTVRGELQGRYEVVRTVEQAVRAVEGAMS